MYDSADMDCYAANRILNGRGNKAARGQVIEAYVCPSDATSGDQIHSNDWTYSSYEMNFQVFAKAKQPIRNNGANFSDILDGTSTTLAFTESLQKCGSQGTLWSHGDWNVVWMPIFGGGKNSDGSGGLTTGTASVPQTAIMQSECNSTRTTACVHPGAIIVALCDGSTDSISKDIDGTTWWRLVRRNDGEVVADY